MGEIAQAYTALAIEQAQAQRLSDARQAFNAASGASHRMRSKERAAETLVAIAKAQIQAGQKEDAQATFTAARKIIKGDMLSDQVTNSWIFRKNRYWWLGGGLGSDQYAKALTLTDIALAQAQVGEIKEAVETAQDAMKGLQEIDSVEERILAQVAIAEVLTAAKKIRVARNLIDKVLQAMREGQASRGRVAVFMRIAEVQTQTGDKRGAQDSLAAAYLDAQNIEDVNQQTAALSDLARTQVRIGEEEDARTTFRTALALVQRVSFHDKDKALENLAIAQAQVGFTTDALETAKQTRHRYEVQRIQIALEQAQRGQKDEAQTTFALVRQANQELEKGWLGGRTERDETLKALAIAQAQVEMFSNALETALMMQSELIKAEALLGIGHMWAQTEQSDWACTAFKEARRAIAEPMYCYEPELLGEIAQAQAQVGEREESRTTMAIALMGEEGKGSNESLLRAVALGEIAVVTAVAQARKGDTVSARKTLALARQAAYEEKSKMLRIIMLEQVKIKDWEGALETALMHPSDTWEREDLLKIIVQALAETAVAQAEEGEEKAARATLAYAQDIARKLPSWHERRAEALTSIAIAQSKMGKKEEAEAIFTTAIDEVKFISSDHKARALAAIAAGQTQIGAFKAAYATAQMSNCDSHYGPRLQGEALKALAVAQVAMAIEQIAQGNETEAQATLDAAFQLLPEIQEEGIQTVALGEIAVLLTKANRRDEARAAFAVAYRIAKSMKGSHHEWPVIDSEHAMKEIAVALARAYEFEEAYKLIQEIESPLTKATGLVAIAKEQAAATKRVEALKTFTDALRIAQEIGNHEYHMSMLKSIAVSQAQAGFGMQAVQTAELILTNRHKHLQVIAKELTLTGDRDSLKRLLIPCAYYLDTAYAMCGFLAQMYPEQTEALARVVRDPS